MNFQTCVVWREGITYVLSIQQLRRTDYVLTTTGHDVAAPEVLYHRERTWKAAPVPGWGAGLAIAGVIVAAAWLLAQDFGPRPRPNVVRRRNREPLESWKKEYVSERDRWRCTYCQKRVTRGNRHIDHSVSRRNGGSNHLNNLRTACRDCNLEKGARNARQFRWA